MSMTTRYDGGLTRCRVCRCTEREPCDPPCSWFEEDLCSLCALAAAAIAGWIEGAHRANLSGLIREAKSRSRGFRNTRPLRATPALRGPARKGL